MSDADNARRSQEVLNLLSPYEAIRGTGDGPNAWEKRTQNGHVTIISEERPGLVPIVVISADDLNVTDEERAARPGLTAFGDPLAYAILAALPFRHAKRGGQDVVLFPLIVTSASPLVFAIKVPAAVDGANTSFLNGTLVKVFTHPETGDPISAVAAISNFLDVSGEYDKPAVPLNHHWHAVGCDGKCVTLLSSEESGKINYDEAVRRAEKYYLEKIGGDAQVPAPVASE